MELPERMIHQSFRYVLGRRSYAVGEWIDWAYENWHRIPDWSKNIIKSDLKNEIEIDNHYRKQNDSMFAPLGSHYDRQSWIDFYNFITKEEDND